MTFRLAVLFALAAVLSACAGQTRWEHPQTGVAAAEQDLAQCTTEARNRTSEYSLASGAGYGQSPTGPSRFSREGAGVPFADETFASAPRRDPQQEQAWITHDCMQAKGYRQVPVPKS